MKKRTRVLLDLTLAAYNLEEARDALTRALVTLEERHGPEERDAIASVAAARDTAYEGDLPEKLENAITLVGRLR